MKFSKQDLLTLLISLFILSGCQNPDGVGLEVDPADAINGTLVDTATVRTVTVPDDVINTSSLTKYPLGYFQDPVFGETEASIAASLLLPSSNLTFGTSPMLDSAVLVLKYANDFYGDSVNSTYAISVHQLNTKLSSNTNFNNTEDRDFNATMIGTKTITKFKLKDSVKITEMVEGKADVQKNVAPQLRISINSTFINDNFLNASADHFTDNTAFTNFIKGLYITIDKAQSSGSGGIVFLDLSSAVGSKLEIHYRNQDGAVVDTNVVTFAIQNGSVPVAATFKHDYTGTPVKAQLDNPAQQYSTTYVQPMAGVRTKLNFPYIDRLKLLGNNIVINKAELVISIDESAQTTFDPAPRLFLYRDDIAGQRQLIPDVDSNDPRKLSDVGFGGWYDSSKKRYKFIITSYIQDILNGKLAQYNTFISVVDAAVDKKTALLPSGTTAARTIIGGGNNANNYKMKLNIIYTKVN